MAQYQPFSPPYQNLFTQVQVVGPLHDGPPLPTERDTRERIGGPIWNYWLGKLGNAQLGPIYLGTLGIMSIFCGIVAIQIMENQYMMTATFKECCGPAITFISQLSTSVANKFPD